jgi:cyclopropane-fatty-acyl-phospholipid synthase
VLSQFVAPGKASFLRQIVEGTGISCEIAFASGQVERFGSGEPQFKLKFKNDRSLRYGFDEFAFADAFVNGDIEIDGDLGALLQLRTRLKDRVRFSAWLKFIHALLFKRETAVNRKAISDHYQHGDDLYLSFIDQRYRFYSQGIFHSEHESLEEASEHKLENMYRALQLRPGMRLLDIGGGWGGVAQYCGSRGVRVTELTLGEDSYRYISDLIRVQNLPCTVLLQDFLSYEPEEPFDAIVIYGVIEHIINYQSFCAQVWKCLRPNGRLFLDASASIVKYDVSGFARKYIWSGTHTFLCLQELIRELLFHGMELLHLDNESVHYGRTMHHWAQRLEQSRDLIIARWGEKLYRAFRLYLWGGSQAFPELLQAYSLVARRMERRPPIVGRWRRLLGWVGR